MLDTAVPQLAADKIVAWMQGRMEFGPRALGNRSILASPLNPYSTENLNILHQAPRAVPQVRRFGAGRAGGDVFRSRPQRAVSSPRWAASGRSTASSSRAPSWAQDLVRVHTVDAEENPLFHKLLHAWGRKTGLPVLYNTSFNLFGDPLVCTPRDAVRSFYCSGIDAMFVGNFLLEK